MTFVRHISLTPVKLRAQCSIAKAKVGMAVFLKSYRTIQTKIFISNWNETFEIEFKFYNITFHFVHEIGN